MIPAKMHMRPPEIPEVSIGDHIGEKAQAAAPENRMTVAFSILGFVGVLIGFAWFSVRQIAKIQLLLATYEIEPASLHHHSGLKGPPSFSGGVEERRRTPHEFSYVAHARLL